MILNVWGTVMHLIKKEMNWDTQHWLTVVPRKYSDNVVVITPSGSETCISGQSVKISNHSSIECMIQWSFCGAVRFMCA
jgi:hypothetical protein